MHRSRKPWIVVAAAATLFAAGLGCKNQQEAQEENLPLLSAIAVASPRAERQLLDGFYQVENNSWRWTRHEFSVRLMPPQGAAATGARLELRFTLPNPVIDRRQAVTLSASVGGTALPPTTYTAAGVYVYKADVPAQAFSGTAPVKVSFSTDKFLRAGEVEARELGLVATTISLLPSK
ncbi:MAG TPA: hypothetical protein VN893_17890 [Bryobacteraceae bacterium]|nr:hypothetical protein [Bryobacteraceae bacterium]